jgi:DNA-binding MarR family transcriptional regulator
VSTEDRTTRRSEPSDLDELATALLRVSRALVGVSVRSLAAVEKTVTITQFRTLVVLQTHDGINLNGLARQLGVNASTAVRMVQRLIAAGLVTRADHPESRREIVLRLSPAGRRVVRRVSARRRAEITRILRQMPPGERRTMVTALQAFSDAAEEPDPPSEAALGW